MKALEKQQVNLLKKLNDSEKKLITLKNLKKDEGRGSGCDHDDFANPEGTTTSYQIMNLQNQIKELRYIVENIEIVNSNSETIEVGSIFSLTYIEDNDTLMATLSDSSEMIDGLEVITTNSEMGKLLLGHKSNDILSFRGNSIKVNEVIITLEKQKKIEK